MASDIIEKMIFVLSKAQDLTVATMRPDGYPQSTTVIFISDGTEVFFVCNKDSQKAANMEANDKVSYAATLPYDNWEEIEGVSVGGHAVRMTDASELNRVGELMVSKYPQVTNYLAEGAGEQVAIYKITPVAASILNYAQGFGHTDNLDFL